MLWGLCGWGYEGVKMKGVKQITPFIDYESDYLRVIFLKFILLLERSRLYQLRKVGIPNLQGCLQMLFLEQCLHLRRQLLDHRCIRKHRKCTFSSVFVFSVNNNFYLFANGRKQSFPFSLLSCSFYFVNLADNVGSTNVVEAGIVASQARLVAID